MKKLLALMLAGLMSATMLMGCASNSTPAAEEKTAEAPAEEAAEAPAEEAPAEEAPAEEAAEIPAEEAATGDKKFKIVVMPKLVGIPYFNGSGEGAMKAAEELGVEVVYTGPTKADAAEQVKMIEDEINKGCDAICVAPNDAAALDNVLKKAKEAGILVLDWDTPANPELVDASVHQINDKVLGEKMVDLLVEQMGTDDAEYGIVTGGLSAANLNAWIKYSTDYAAEKYPNLKLVSDPQPSDEKQQEAMKKAIDMIAAYPNIKGFLGYSTPAPLGIAQGVREKGMQDSIAVVGTSVKEDSQEYLADGALDVGVLWDPARLGYLTVATAKHLLEGGELSTLTVEGFDELSFEGINVYMGAPDEYRKEG